MKRLIVKVELLCIMLHGGSKEEDKEKEEGILNYMIVQNVWNCLSRLATRLTLKTMISLHHFSVLYLRTLMDH